MDAIAAVLFEPVGCLAEFPIQEFDAAAQELFAVEPGASTSGSHAYWRVLGLIEKNEGVVDTSALDHLAELELAAVERAELYEDVIPSLEKLKSAGVRAYLVSSLSRKAIARFIERFGLGDMFAGSVTRDDAHGIAARPLRHAIERELLDSARAIYLVDTARALEIAKQLGVNALLMINDYDEGRALAERNPAGGVVSLAELADALQLIEQRAGLRPNARLPKTPFELFEPG